MTYDIYRKGIADIDASELSVEDKCRMRIQLSGMMHTKMVLDRVNDGRRNIKAIGKYGISYLDECLYGIMPQDLILIGADTGCGKSQLAYDIAFNNATDKKVHLIALECDEDEPYMRRYYKHIAAKYYDSSFLWERQNLTYRKFVLGQVDVSSVEPAATAEMAKLYTGLTVHYRGKSFGLKDLLEKMDEISGHCDMLILDHVDYFDLDIKENEHFQVAEIMKALREINQTYKIPIVVVSHMRKKSNRKQIIPGVEDFFGTSSKAKQVKTIIILARDYAEDDYEHYRYGTFVYIAKGGRLDPPRNVVARMMFDGLRSEYEKEYLLARIVNYSEDVAPMTAREFQDWAINAREVRTPYESRKNR